MRLRLPCANLGSNVYCFLCIEDSWQNRLVAAVIKTVNVAGEPIIFATQRGYGDLKGGWEFPGGKIEAGETPQAALKRK